MEEEGTIETRIDEALRSRVEHFKAQADSLTFEGVRRLLEKDLGLDTHSLDAHKKYVKTMLQKCLNDTEDSENISKDSGQTKLEQVKEEEEDRPKEVQTTEDVKEIRSEDEGKTKDSPVMGLLTESESVKSEDLKNQGSEKDAVPSEATVKAAIRKRAAYFRSKSEELTMAGVRRLLEEDLELEKFSLDPLKKVISKQLDAVLNTPEVPESVTPVKKKPSVKSRSEKAVSSDSESDDEDVKVKPKKKVAPKGKAQKSEGSNKRKRPAKEKSQKIRKKQTKVVEETSEEKKSAQDDEDQSSAEKSDSSAEKSAKNEAGPSSYGKKVENLKSIIKSCGMSVPPVIYKKAKQAPEDKREAFIINELREILSKEGLSTNPTPQEIKEVKRRKERAKELEGIDMSNIVLGSRRRPTANFVAPPIPKAPVEADGDGDDSEDSNNEESNEEDEDGDAHTSQSEEVHEDTEDSD